MWNKYGFSIFVALAFFPLLLLRPDTADISDFEAICLVAFSMLPLSPAGNIGAKACEEICKFTGELLKRFLNTQYRVKFQETRIPAFIYEFLTACAHCVFASIMASTNVYRYFIFALFRDDEWILATGTKPVIFLYITIFIALFFMKQFFGYQSQRRVNALNAELSQ